MPRPRRSFPADFKAQIVLQLRTGANTQAELCRKHDLKPQLVAHWKAMLLGFHANYADLAQRMVRAITDHATPVGSGTVARTKRIPVEQRAEAAVIAWMRHKTTGYDGRVIPRIKGKRRAAGLVPADLKNCWGGIGGEMRSGKYVH